MKRKVTKETLILGIGYVILDTLILAVRPCGLVGPSGLEPPYCLSLVTLEKRRLRLIRVQNLCLVLLVGPSGLEPPTSCLSGTRSNLLSYEPMWLFRTQVRIIQRLEVGLTSYLFLCVSTELSSRTVARKVFSPLQSLTSVFGMGTGGPSAFIALTLSKLSLTEN